MKYFRRGAVVLAVFTAVIAPALVAGAQSSDDIDYWNAAWENEASCFKDSHGSITDDGLAVVLSEYDPSWGGTRWEGLAVYAGDEFAAYQFPDAGAEYPAPNGAAVTSWVACKGTDAQETTTTTTTAAPEETTTTTAAPEETTTTAAPEETTTTTSSTAAPAGGVAAGAGGTAGSDQSDLWVLGGLAAIAIVVGVGYAGRRRSES